MADATTVYPGLLTGITNDYMHVFEGYTSKFITYGKEMFVVLLAINISWIAIWYAFDKDSLAAGMSDFLKKFTVAILFYSVMITPSFIATFVNSSTDMGLGVTGLDKLDPSSIITLGANAGFRIVGGISIFSFNAIANIIFGMVAFFIVIFCFMTVALQVAIAQIIASALVMFSCFSLSFAAFGQTAPIARKSIDALISICFKLLGYYIVIGSSFATFNKWQSLPDDFFSEPRNNLWICAAALVFWLLSKSLAGVFERIGGGLIGETAGVDFAALAISAAKTAVMGLAKTPSPPGGNLSGGPGGKSKGFQESSWGKAGSLSKTAANDPTPSGPTHTGGGQMQVKTPGAARANDAVSKGSTQNNAANDANKSAVKSTTAANDSHAGKDGGHSKGASSGQSSPGSGRARTYPGMSKDKPKQAIGA